MRDLQPDFTKFKNWATFCKYVTISFLPVMGVIESSRSTSHEFLNMVKWDIHAKISVG